MGPMEVCQHITNNFAVSAATYTDDENGYQFHIKVDNSVQFSSFYAYVGGDIQEAIDDITAVLIKMRLELDEAPVAPQSYGLSPLGESQRLEDIRLNSYDGEAIRLAFDWKIGPRHDSELFQSTYSQADPESDPEKEKGGPTLDEEFPVQPNGFRFL